MIRIEVAITFYDWKGDIEDFIKYGSKIFKKAFYKK